MIVAGIGCRKGASQAEVEAAIDEAFAQAKRGRETLRLIATSDGKGNEPGIVAAAEARGVPLLRVSPADLEAAGTRTQSFSPRVKALVGVPSVAEAAALAAGGPKATLLLPRIAVGPVTCALADTNAS
ncbi:cobalamin biosynthesis protein [Methyloceanibacter sp.]|uniref:cobalamin biosynthesis protein n=1 Tax=Methyloceanibacter sp. TaxID=1965321 RepID=UPI002D34E020|nr:cobalamin biosynthesis protein [Methyloceanibacter sp.]HZP08016.1 cobalamin biosynthesis protein [Methyloceanibacter sp.]